MYSIKYAVITAIIIGFTPVQALVTPLDVNKLSSPNLVNEQSSASIRVISVAPIYLAGKPKSSEKTTTRTTRDGDTVTREVTRTNDGQGNKTVTKKKTTTSSSSENDSNSGSGGSGGASYEGL